MSCKKPIPVRLSKGVIDQLDRTASAIGSSRAALIRLCVVSCLDYFDTTGKVMLPLDWKQIIDETDGRRNSKEVNCNE